MWAGPTPPASLPGSGLLRLEPNRDELSENEVKRLEELMQRYGVGIRIRSANLKNRRLEESGNVKLEMRD